MTASYFFEGNYFMDWCLKFGQMIEVVMASYKEVYKDMQKMAEQSKITSFFTKSSVSPLSFTLHYLITLKAYTLGHRHNSRKHKHITKIFISH